MSTLKEKFETKQAIQFPYESKAHASYCEKIADDYATEFAEWVIDYSFNGMYSNDINELLKEFKKEKGL
jgi:hypothetical protein